MRWVRWMTLTGFTFILVAPAPRGAAAEEGGSAGREPSGSAASAMRPRIEVDQLEQDAGEVEPGRKVDYSFPIRNTGELPLEIRAVTADHGCLVAEFDRTIPPGGVGKVRASLSTTGRRGDLRTRLKLTCNDPLQPAVTLSMAAHVSSPVQILPSEEILVPLVPGRAAVLEAVIRCTEAAPLRILKLESSHPSLQVRLVHSRATERKPGATETKPADKAQREHRLELAVPKGTPTAPFDATVTLHTDHPEHARLTIRVTGYPHKSVVANPPRLFFGDVTEGPAAVSRTITLFRRGGAFRVLEATTADPALALRVEPDPDGSFSDVHVSYRGGWQPGPIAGKILIRTDDPDRPTIEVPYEAVVDR